MRRFLNCVNTDVSTRRRVAGSPGHKKRVKMLSLRNMKISNKKWKSSFGCGPRPLRWPRGKSTSLCSTFFGSDILVVNPLPCLVLTAGVLCTASPLFFCKCFTWNNFYENKIFTGKIAQSPLQIPKYLLGSKFCSK